MSDYNRKGYTTIKALDSRGRTFNAAVPVTSGIARKINTARIKADRVRKLQLRQEKARIREAKKQVPLAIRAKVNWSKLSNKEVM